MPTDNTGTVITTLTAVGDSVVMRCHQRQRRPHHQIVGRLTSLVAVIIIGWRSVRLGERAAKASEESAKGSQVAAMATQEAAAASGRAAEATERSVAASERAAGLAAQDAWVRRLEAALDVALAMREMLNAQTLNLGRGLSPSELLDRVAMTRKLAGRVVPFGSYISLAPVRDLVALPPQSWSTNDLEAAIQALTDVLRVTVQAP